MARRVVATNRKARHEYFVEKTFEAGIELHGSEVKSLRDANVSLNECYAQVHDGQAWVVNMRISPYRHATNVEQPEPDRRRRLLLKRREIEQIDRALKQKGYTLIPLSIYFNDRGYAKVEVGLCRGKRQYDKRETIAERDAERDMERSRRDFERSR